MPVFSDHLQSVASSLAKHGGALFSAVSGSIKDPIGAPGPYEPQEYKKKIGVVPAITSFTTSAKRVVPMVLIVGFSNGFLLLRTESICQRTNPCEQSDKSHHPHQ